MAHEPSSYAKFGAKTFRVFDYRQRNSSKKKRIIVSTDILRNIIFQPTNGNRKQI